MTVLRGLLQNFLLGFILILPKVSFRNSTWFLYSHISRDSFREFFKDYSNNFLFLFNHPVIISGVLPEIPYETFLRIPIEIHSEILSWTPKQNISIICLEICSDSFRNSSSVSFSIFWMSSSKTLPWTSSKIR